jgi:ABC-2 type transport system permease protein
MKKAFAVAKWEYLEKIKSKSFIISLFLTPIIMIGVGVVPSLLMSRPDAESIVIGIVDLTGTFSEPFGKALESRYKLQNGQPNYILNQISITSGSNITELKTKADQMVLDKVIEGYLIIGANILNDSSIDYRSRNAGNIKITTRLERVLKDVVMEKKAAARGLDPSVVKEITASLDLNTIKITKEGKEEQGGFEKIFLSSYVFMMMMFFLIMTSGQLLVRSMLEEKSNRVVEVLMSSSPANQLMAGKILGLSALGLTQIGFWAIIGVVLSLKFSMTMIPLASAAVLLIYFILGYLFYAAIFVAAGAPLTTEQEAQQVTGYLVMVLIIPIVLTIMIIQNPDSTLSKILSYVPFLTASMMAVRIPIQMPSVFEIVTTIILLVLSSIAAIWVAGKIFRTTILSYGKRPSIKELWILVKSK